MQVKWIRITVPKSSLLFLIFAPVIVSTEFLFTNSLWINIFFTSLAKVFTLQWEIVAVTATISVNHARLKGASESTDLFYQATDALGNYKVQFWQVFTILNIYLKWAPTLTLTGILQAAAHLRKDSTTDACIPKPKANCLSIKRLHHLRM